MTAPIGRREANKQATRSALQEAAAKLFDDQGYEQTTVRDIATTAGVTERTFFRYFESKEDLVADQTLDWLPLVQAIVMGRPADESPVTAVREALIDLGRAAAAIEIRRPIPLWLFNEGPPAPRMRRSAPGLLIKFESGLAEAIRARLSGEDADYRADIIARAAVAACRSAYIRDWQQRTMQTDEEQPTLEQLLRKAFEVMGER